MTKKIREKQREEVHQTMREYEGVDNYKITQWNKQHIWYSIGQAIISFFRNI